MEELQILINQIRDQVMMHGNTKEKVANVLTLLNKKNLTTAQIQQIVVEVLASQAPAVKFFGVIKPATVLPSYPFWAFAEPGVYNKAGGFVVDIGKLGVISYDGATYNFAQVSLQTVVSVRKANSDASNLMDEDVVRWLEKLSVLTEAQSDEKYLQEETLTLFGEPILKNNILTLKYTGENGVEQVKNVDLSGLVTKDVKVENASYDAATNIITITDSEGEEFKIDLSEFSLLTEVDADGTLKVTQEGVEKFKISKAGQSGKFEDLEGVPGFALAGDLDAEVAARRKADDVLAERITTNENRTKSAVDKMLHYWDTSVGKWISSGVEFVSSSYLKLKIIAFGGYTIAQKNAITNPVEGMLIYQNEAPKGFQKYENGAWSQIGGNISNTDLTTVAARTFTQNHDFTWNTQGKKYFLKGLVASLNVNKVIVLNANDEIEAATYVNLQESYTGSTVPTLQYLLDNYPNAVFVDCPNLTPKRRYFKSGSLWAYVTLTDAV